MVRRFGGLCLRSTPVLWFIALTAAMAGFLLALGSAAVAERFTHSAGARQIWVDDAGAGRSNPAAGRP